MPYRFATAAFSSPRTYPEEGTGCDSDHRVVRMVPDGWCGIDTARIPTNTVVEVTPGHHLVLRQLIPATGQPTARLRRDVGVHR